MHQEAVVYAAVMHSLLSCYITVPSKMYDE